MRRAALPVHGGREDRWEEACVASSWGPGVHMALRKRAGAGAFGTCTYGHYCSWRTPKIASSGAGTTEILPDHWNLPDTAEARQRVRIRWGASKSRSPSTCPARARVSLFSMTTQKRSSRANQPVIRRGAGALSLSPLKARDSRKRNIVYKTARTFRLAANQAR